MNIATNLLPWNWHHQLTISPYQKMEKKELKPRLSGGRMNDPIYVNAYMNVTQVFPLIRR